MPKPTYREANNVLIDEYICSLCCSLIIDKEGHTRWHERLEHIFDDVEILINIE